MDNKMDYIDKLYSEKIDSFEFQSSEGDWDRLSSKLTKANFLKFSFVTFNIYYLSAIVTFFAFLSYFGLINIQATGKTGNPHNSQKNTIELNTVDEEEKFVSDSIMKSSFQDEHDIQNDRKVKDNFKETKTGIAAAKDSLKIETTKKIALAMEDSLYKNIDTITNTKSDTSFFKMKQTPKIKRVKKTIIIKKEQVIVTDTVKIKKIVK